MRSDLNRILLRKFEALGGRVIRHMSSVDLTQRGETITNLVEPSGLQAGYTIDATGRTGMLPRALGIREFQVSPRLIAQFGYRLGAIRTEPTFIADAAGWSWTAQVAKGHISAPEPVAHLPATGREGAADVTWRIAETVAGPEVFIAGRRGHRARLGGIARLPACPHVGNDGCQQCSGSTRRHHDAGSRERGVHAVDHGLVPVPSMRKRTVLHASLLI